MKVKVNQINAFVGGKNGGNAAGVVLDADLLSDVQMQKIAYDLGYSETAFVLKSEKVDYRVRFFTTGTEVPLCGHATLATRFLLQNKGLFTKTEGKQETLAGMLTLKFDGDTVIMEQALPIFSTDIDKQGVLDSLNITEQDLIPNIPIELVSTGFPTIFVPIKSLERVKSLTIDLNKGRDISKKTNLIHPFTLETLFPNSTAFSRNFFPDITEDEDMATGTSTGALACYLFKYKLLNSKDINNLIFDQGNFANQPCRLIVKLETVGETINRVWVGGKCELIKEFEIDVL